MRRAIIFRYDPASRRVRAAGRIGLDLEQFASAHVTVESAPITAQALREDRVVEVAGDVRDGSPGRVRRAVPRAGAAGVRADGRRRPRDRRDPRRPAAERAAARRRRAPPAVDAGQGGGAGLGRADRGHPGREGQAARAADRPRPRDPRGRDPAAVRRLDGARRRRAICPPTRASAAPARRRPRSAICAARSSARSAARRGPPRRRSWPRCERLARVHPDLGVAASSRRRGRRAGGARAARPVGAHRSGAQRAQARRPRRGSASGSAGRRRVRAGGGQRRRRRALGATRGWACAWPRSRRCRAAGWSSSASASREPGRCDWSSRTDEWRWLTADPQPRAPAGAGGRRPRRRALGVPADADPAAVGRALPERRTGREALDAGRPLPPARRARRPVHRRGVRRRDLRAAARGRAEHARAAVLGRRARSPPAPRARPAPPGSPTRTGRRRKIASAVRLVGLGKTVFERQDRQGALGLSRARARGARADGRRARPTPRSPRRCICPSTRSRSTPARSTASSACATGPRPCSGPSGSA